MLNKTQNLTNRLVLMNRKNIILATQCIDTQLDYPPRINNCFYTEVSWSGDQ